MKYTLFSLLLTALLAAPMAGTAQHDAHEETHTAAHQEDDGHDDDHGHHAFKRHKLAVLTGNTWVIKGNHDERTGAVLLPTFGLDYEYWFNHVFALGLYNDVTIGRYLVENEQEEEVKRENAVVFTVDAIVEPVHGWALYAGAGIELEHHEHLWVVRIGTEYAWELPKNWTIALTGAWDIKKHYDSFSSGIVIGRRLGKAR